MMRTCRSYIAGDWTAGPVGKAIELGNPANRTEIVSKIFPAAPAEAISASYAAAHAWHNWRNLTVAERIVFFEQINAEILQNAAELASTAQSSFAPRRSTRKRHRNTENVHLQTRNEKRAEHQDTTSPDAAKSSSTALQSPRLPRRPTEKENRHHWVRSCF